MLERAESTMSATETSRGDDEALPAEVGSDESSPPVNPWRSPRQVRLLLSHSHVDYNTQAILMF